MVVQHFTYHDVPTVGKFRKDSSVAFGIRSDDRILTHLDRLLEYYSDHTAKGDYSMRRVILADLFLTANYWIKLYHERNPLIKKERYPAVLALFEAVVNKLCYLLKCTKGQVAAQIEEIFGRDLTEGGANTDIQKNALYFDKLARKAFRLRFRGGLVYHYDLSARGPAELILVDSKRFYTDIIRGGSRGFENWAPFVMTLEREFYMTRHTLNEPGKPNVFHSAYTAGGTVAGAGTMEIVQGRILGIRPDSGHYKPLENNIVGVLQALEMFMVDLKPIRVFDFLGNELGTALDFIRSRLSWQAFQAARADFRAKRAQDRAPLTPKPPRPPGVAQQETPAQYSKTPAEYNNQNNDYIA